jgi:TM2 domain-containing membrane protein YozV
MTLSDPPDKEEPYSTGISYLLWLSCLFGVCGIHRFYLGKTWTGLLYLLTFGCLGVGQVIDLFKMRDLVLLENTKAKMLGKGKPRERLTGDGAPKQLLPARPPMDPREEIRMKLVRAAAVRGGKLNVSQGVMATGKPFKEVEAILDEMAKSGYVGIDNDPDTGVVIYTFGELG